MRRPRMRMPRRIRMPPRRRPECPNHHILNPHRDSSGHR
jgi:hypothetical protein